MKNPSQRRQISRFALTLLALGFGCHASESKRPAASAQAVRAAAQNARARSGPPALRASELTRVPSVTFGPYLGMRDDGGLVVWASLEGSTRSLQLVPLSSRGRPRGAIVQGGPVPEAIGLVVVRPFAAGYAVAYTSKTKSVDGVRAVCVGADAELGSQSDVTPLNGRALWLEVVPFGSGALTLYAVQGREKRRAEIWAAVLDSGCKLSAPTLVVKEADAWQAVKLGSAVLIASVVGARSGGDVVATIVDPTGSVKKSSSIASNVKADVDLDAVAVGERAIVAWTNKKALDPRVETAVVGVDGQVERAPLPLTPPNGEQTLIRLVPPARGSETAYVAWERLDARHDEAERRISLGALTRDGRLDGAGVEIEYASADAGMPEMAAAPHGLAVMTLASVCRRNASCNDDSEVAPTFVRFDEHMNVVASEPLRLAPLAGGRAELGFGIGCTRDGCFAISALSQVPAPVFSTELEALSNSWRAPVIAPKRGSLPVLEHETIARTDSVATFTTDVIQGQDYLAYVTDFDPTTPWVRLKKPALDGRLEPLRAKIMLAPIAAAANEREPELISLRAESRAGVTLVPAVNRDQALMAWAGVDAGTPQVFLTLVSKDGAKVLQRMLTRKKGDLGDIAAVAVDDGWIVAWIDERSGDPEVYAAKIDAKLNRSSPEQRITTAPGAASDLALAYDGTHVRAVWADARGADLSGHSDIYTALLKPRDASRDGDELRVAETAPHSFAPVLRAARGGFMLAWIERAEGSEAGRVAVAQIDAKGAPGVPTLLAAAGSPRAVNLACAGETCRLAAISDQDESVRLVAAGWQSQPPSEMTPVLELSGGAAAQARPAFRGDDILYVDASSDEARIRRVKLKW